MTTLTTVANPRRVRLATLTPEQITPEDEPLAVDTPQEDDRAALRDHLPLAG